MKASKAGPICRASDGLVEAGQAEEARRIAAEYLKR
jgi:hypothetical protein